MTSITADLRLANRSDARRELLERLERVLQPLEDEIRNGDLTELMADALAQDPRDANWPCATLSSASSAISWADPLSVSTIMALRSGWTACAFTGRSRRWAGR